MEAANHGFTLHLDGSGKWKIMPTSRYATVSMIERQISKNRETSPMYMRAYRILVLRKLQG